MLWGSEVKIEQSALLERLEIQEKYRGWGIGTWFFDEVWKSDLDHGVPKVSFPQPIPDEIVSSTDTTIGLVPVRAARANLRPRAAPADWAAEHLRLGARRLSATREDESAPLLPTSEIEPRQARLQAKPNVPLRPGRLQESVWDRLPLPRERPRAPVSLVLGGGGRSSLKQWGKDRKPAFTNGVSPMVY